MKQTKDLFGVPRSQYEPELTVLCNKRINDGQKLLKRLSRTKGRIPKAWLPKWIERYSATEKAVKHWREILEEE